MSNTYNIIGTPNADGTLKEFGNTSPKVESPAAVNVSFDNTGTSLQSDNAEDAIKEIDEKVGDTDISSIGDGTTTGAISTINSNLIPEAIPLSSFITPTGSTIYAGGQAFKIGKLVFLNLQVGRQNLPYTTPLFYIPTNLTPKNAVNNIFGNGHLSYYDSAQQTQVNQIQGYMYSINDQGLYINSEVPTANGKAWVLYIYYID